jgi:hypothetical protein
VTRRPSARGFNAALAAALALVVLGGGAAVFGRGCERIERYEGELRERSERAEAWALQRSYFRNPSDAVRAARLARWGELLERVEVVEGQAALIAHVAEKLYAPSVRGLEVERSGTAALVGEDEALPATRYDAPEGGESVALVSIPITVSLRTSYADAFALLERIERRQVAARLDSLDIKRQPPGVLLQLGLTWYTRNPQEGAG